LTAAPASLRHRPEIDGLRALAILPILLLHTGVTALQGGHVGVDIFFVISGYLITAIVTREIADGSFSLADFYRRRIVRILPALTVMLGAVLAVGCVVLFPTPLRDLGWSAAATAAFGSNVYFYATSDYFAQASDLKPLVHTWSLAVEEQFYLLYPLLLLALRRWERRARIAAMLGLAVTSFAIGAWLAATDLTAGFYLLPARIWELVIGGLVAMGAYPRLASAALRELLCWIGLAAILAGLVLIRPSWPFPVPFALAPAGGAALLLAYTPGTRAAALLSVPPLRWIGFISYSLYLWHRPIIAFYLTGRSWIMTPRDTAVLLALSFGAATLSYLVVERPALRRWRSGSGLLVHGMALTGLAAFAATGLSIAANAVRIRELPPPVARIAGYLGFDRTAPGRAQYGTDTCFVLPYGKPYDPACLAPAPGRANVLLVGDSHAAQLSQALRAAIGPAHLMQATAAGCRPLLVTVGLASCHRLVLQALEHTDLSQVSGVILAGRWFDADTQGLADTVRALRRRGVPKVVVLGPMVEYEGEMPDLLGRAMLARDLDRMAGLRVADRQPLDAKLRPMVEQAGGRYLSYFEDECPQHHCRLFTSDGAPIHVDQAHLTPQAARPVAQRIARELSR
jgi:peptidoglycan/LPS O-acetylase OafA/YrhL